MPSAKKIMCLFDVDGTLTKPRIAIEDDFYNFLLNKVKPLCTLGLVGGSDFKKIAEQMKGEDVVNKFEYVFAENGLVQFKQGKEIGRQSIQNFLGEEALQTFINFVLKYLSTIKLPVKRGNFVEFRSGMLNISPVGRSCSQEEREAFLKYDNEHNIRKTMIESLKKEFPDMGVTYSIGGQISFDVFPNGWDKTFCLRHLENEGFDEIHFFGDKTDQGGNDYEIFNDKRVIGHKVVDPSDTKKQLQNIFKL
nr:probable phosphomannomutase [Leptinotarsa decemlineata]